MSQAQALLNSLEDVEVANIVNTNGDKIVIDEYRTIHVPDSLRRLGVQHDHNIETVTFTCPRYWDGNDMSQMKIYVNYLRLDGVKGRYLTTNLKVNDDTMDFDWVVSNNVTQVKGTLSFLICIVKTDADGMEERHWNSELNQECYISEGMECQETVIIGYPDIITHLLIRMEETEAVANEESLREFTNSWLEQNHDRLLAEIEVEAKNALDSIPPDYTEVYELAHDSVRTRANAIVRTKQGEAIFVSDSSDDYLRGLRIFGKTEQYVSTGLNILDPNAVATFLNNNASEKTGIAIPIETAGVYTYIIKDSVTVYIGYTQSLTSNAVHFATAVKDSGIKGTVSLSEGQYFLLWYDAGVTGKNTEAYFLGLGNNVEFEPYTEGNAAPSPDWPMDLRSVENPSVSIRGKNLVQVSGDPTTWNGITFTPNTDGGVVVDGTSTALSYLNFTLTLAPGDYILTGCPPGGNDATYFLRAATTYDGIYDDRGDGVNFTLTESQGITVRIAIRAGITADAMVFKPMVRAASITDDTFESFISRQILDTSHTLCGIPVDTDGNYTDSNGQQWICDEVDFERGVYVQRVGTQTFNNAFEYLNVSSVDGSGVFYCGLSGYDPSSYDLGMMSTHFRFAGYDTHNSAAVGHLSAGEFSYIRNPTAGARLYFAVAGVTSKEEATEWLASNTPTVYYPLKTPVETTLTATELEAFKWCHTNQPNTTILNDSGTIMEVKYNADTQIYLEQLPKATDDQVQAAVDAWLSAHYSTAEGVSF